jgi:uncharacterized Zn finger protein
MSWWGYKPYVSVAQKRAKAERELQKLAKTGRAASPVIVEGRTITRTFWGKAWAKNLEAYSDFASRLPRGRSYVCNGCVLDLQIEAGRVRALVMGSDLYEIDVKIAPLPKEQWAAVKSACAGQIGSLVELLQGKLSKSVMEVVTAPGTGLFPKPKEIALDCSCPDWADMCKHVAAVLYGVGTRLDDQPELLFKLRGVDHLELIAAAPEVAVPAAPAKGKAKRLAASELADVFGIEFDGPAGSDAASSTSAQTKAARTPRSASPKQRAKRKRSPPKS